MKNLRCLFVLFVLLLTSCQSGLMSAANLEDTLRPVLQRHDALLTGQLDPATLSAEDKVTYRRSSYLLLRTLDIALGKEPPAPPPDLNLPAPVPVSQ